jgi:hypothetical protein
MIAMSSSERNRGLSLAKLAAFFGAMFIVSLGICGYSVHTGDEFGGTPGFLSFTGMIISAVFLLAIGVTVAFRVVRDTYYK